MCSKKKKKFQIIHNFFVLMDLLFELKKKVKIFDFFYLVKSNLLTSSNITKVNLPSIGLLYWTMSTSYF